MGYPPKVPTRKFILRYTGIFDFDGLYKFIAEYFKARRYWFKETKYKHKVPSALGAEQEITFAGDQKVTDYISYDLKVDMHIWDMTEVEVEKAGIKKKLLSARIEIVFQGTVNFDWEKRWETSTTWQWLKEFWSKFIAKEELETVYWDTLHYRTQAFMNAVKEFLDMEAKGYEYAGYLGDNV